MARTQITRQQVLNRTITTDDIDGGLTAGYVLTTGVSGAVAWEAPAGVDGVTGPTGPTGAIGFIWSAVPGSTGASGTTGDTAHDSAYLYVCVGVDEWKRTSLDYWT